MLDYQLACENAIHSPRVYLDNKKLDVEPGFTFNDSFAIPDCNISKFAEQDMYFGGVHTVTYYNVGKL